MRTGEPLRAAGGFTIDGFGAPFIDGVDGDPNNVLGLSVSLLRVLLRQLGVVDRRSLGLRSEDLTGVRRAPGSRRDGRPQLRRTW